MKLDLKLFEAHPSWPAVRYVHRVLKDKGHESLLAGGCVRDGLIGRRPKDFDIATDAVPAEVESYFEKTIDIGKSFGVIIVHHQGENIEVTTFRKDGDYKDGRHPEKVDFSSAEEDAIRRDFTINGLFYDLDLAEVRDYVDGVQDLEKGLIRAVGVPHERFEEDQLRVLRAIRFAAELDFDIEESTWKSLLLFRHKVQSVSAERITEELRKVFLSENPLKGMLLLNESLILKELWPELKMFQSSLYEKWVYKAFAHLKGERRLDIFLGTLTLLESFFEYEHVGGGVRVQADRQIEALMRFRFPRDVIRNITYALRNFALASELNTKSLTLLAEPNGGILLLDLIKMYYFVRGEEMDKIEEFLDRYLKLCDDKGALPKRLITGEDIEALRIPHGPIYKEILEEAYIKQLDGYFENLESAKEWLSGQYGLSDQKS